MSEGKSNGVVTWRILATAAWMALSAVLLFWMENVSTRLDALTNKVAVISGWIDAHKNFDPPH
jgi:hypothetical protein